MTFIIYTLEKKYRGLDLSDLSGRYSHAHT